MKIVLSVKAVATVMILWSANLSVAQSTQTIRGQVTDDVSKTSLPGVNVVVLVDGVNTLGGSTDVDGNFRINNVPVGRQTIQASFIGYEPQVVPNILVTAGKEVVLNFSLRESVSQLNEVVVTSSTKDDKALANNDLALVSARSFNVDDTKRYAGALGDPSRMAANFAGVVGGNDSRNDIVVRGNSPLGMLWQLEGMNIPNPNHFGALVSTGGPVSMLNNNNIDKSDFMSGAFPAQYGNAVASVFDIKLKDGNNEKHEFLGQVGFNGFEGGAEGPISQNSKSSYIVNYRYSTLGLFEAMGIQFGAGSSTPIYQDINFKLTFPTKKGKFTVFGLGGLSSIDLLGSEADLGSGNNLYGSENYDSYPRYRTGMGGVSYEWNISEKTFAKVTLGVSASREQLKLDSLERDVNEDVIAKYRRAETQFETQKGSLVFFTRTKLNSKNSITSGLYIDVQLVDLYQKISYPNVNKDTIRVDVNDNTQLYQAHTTWKHRFNTKFSSQVGVHLQGYSLNNQVVVEPRASFQYLINAAHSLSIGYGIHNQVQSVYTSFAQTKTPTGYELTNKDLDFTTSQHFILTYDWNISENLRLKAETYYQQLSNIPVEIKNSSYSAINTGAAFVPSYKGNLVNEGTGRNYGLELTLERFFNKGFYFLATTSLFDSKYEGSDGIERNTAFNTRYIMNALVGREWQLGTKKNFFSVNLKVTTIGGKYLTPLDFELSQQYGREIYQDNQAFSERQSPYFRTDLRFAYRKEYKRSTFEASIDLQNLTNRQNIFSQIYNPRTNTIVDQYQQSFFPVPYLRFTF
jgi:hypothetical protein